MPIVKQSNDTEGLFKGLARVVAPPPDLLISEWADEKRVLSPEASAEPGKWRTERTPYLKDIMDAISDPSVETVVIKSSSQVGKTEVLLNTFGYHVDYDPAPMMYLLPTKDLAQDFSKDRLASMIRDTPVLNGKVKDARSRDSNNTLLHKGFPGGHITLVGANSPSGLSSRPIRILLADEVDRFPHSAGTEGDPITLAEKRTTTFWNRKKVYVSTPTIRGASRIETAYEGSSQEEWCLPCPNCGEYQPLTFGQIRFEDVTHECLYCRSRHKELEWKAREGKWIAQNDMPSTRGFHLSELVSPWKRWETIIKEFKEAKKGGRETLKAWVNTSLGETWEEEGEGVEPENLLKRRERYNCQVPDEVLVLTCGVDVQDNRLEYEILGWGMDYETWGIRYGVIMGDPGRKFVWKMLDAVLDEKHVREDGTKLQIMTTCVDSGGHYTSETYKYCKARELKRVWAIKGQGGPVPFIQRPKKRNQSGCWLFTIGVDVGKDTITSRLKTEEEGPGYCHFPMGDRGYDRDYFNGLAAEHRKLRYSKGKAIINWEKRTPGARNEPFDIRNYATAAMEILNPPMEYLKRQMQSMVKEKKPKDKPKLPGRRAGVINKGINI